MATITFKYRENNKQAKNLLNYILSTGLLVPEITENSGIVKALEDLKKGRIYHAARKQKV
jgi:hypothetical protein